jgi:hypothetical protein
MRRFTSMKVAFATVLSCLALLVGMFATTGTVSAHSTSSADPAHFVDPRIRVVFVIRAGNDCTTFLLVGRDFSSHGRVILFAEGVNDFNVRIFPRSVRANRDGNFDTIATVCADFQFQSCGEFIENPFFFCGFGLNPNEFCQFESCFPGSGVFTPDQPFTTPGLFHPVPVFRFCQFHNLPFCFRFHRHSILVLIAAVDVRTGIQSNITAVRIFRPFFF